MPKSDQGVTRDRYSLIPRVLVFLTRRQSVLLLKGDNIKHTWAGKFNGVGGHVERGEDVLAAARRELLEETGISTNLRLCGVVVVDVEKDMGVCIHVFSGEYSGNAPLCSSEGELKWVDFSEIDQLPVVEDVPVLVRYVRKVMMDKALFFLRSYYNQAGELVIE